MIPFKGRPDSGSSSENPRAYKSGPRQGSTSAPNYAELRNPTLVSSAISLDTNVTTSVPIMVRPWLDKWEQKITQGSLLFVWEGSGTNRMHVAADVPTLNYLLENSQNQLNNRSSNLDKEYQVKTLSDYKWNLFGVVRNDLLANSSLRKLYNCDVFGRAMIANIFGKLSRSDHVGLALIETDCAKQFNSIFYSPNGRPDAGIKTQGPATAGGPNKKHLQVVGTTNGKINDFILSKDPDLKILREYPLGVVSHAVAKIPTQGNILMSLRNQDKFLLLPRVEILLI